MYQTNMPIYTGAGLNNSSPTTTKYTMEQQYANMQNQLQQFQNPQQQQQALTDPYTDYSSTMRSCSKIVQDKIYNDPSYRRAEYNWELLKEQALNEILVPQLLNTQIGKTRCEELYQVTVKCKDYYEQEESENNNKIQELLNNPDALKLRLQELEANNQKVAQQSAVATPIVTQETVQPTQNNNGKNKNNGGNN